MPMSSTLACNRNAIRLLAVLLGVCLAAAAAVHRHQWQPCSSSSSSSSRAASQGVNRRATRRALLAPARSLLSTNPSGANGSSSRASNRTSVAISSTDASRKPRAPKASPTPPKWGGLRDAELWPTSSGNIEDSRGTQAEAFTSTQGPDEDDNPGDPFNAYTTEKSSIAPPAGAYFDDDGDQVLALDAQIGVWGSSWGHRGRASRHRPNFRRQNPTRTKVGNTTVSHFKLEAGTQRGVQAMAGTFEGARAAAGSDSSFNLADDAKDLPLGFASVYSSNNEASGPTPGRRVVVRDGERRSVAFTNLPPTSAAHSGSGYGTAASAAGWEVAASSRSDRGTDEPRATIGHRPAGRNGAFDSTSSSSGHRRRRRLLLW